MLFRITHSTRYRYSRSVYIEPMTVRLRPRDQPFQRVLRHELVVAPEPSLVCEHLDAEGNCAATCWFEGVTDSLTFTTTSEVETSRTNPFDFYLAREADRLPMVYAPDLASSLANYCTRTRGASSDLIAQLAAEVLSASENKTVAFLTTLANRIHSDCETIVRPEGDPWPAAETWRKRTGACRDLSVLFNEVCRAVGLATRFVSGYYALPDADDKRHLHAWSEVYLPGAGWRGFDPGLGLAVVDQHVAVAAGAHPQAAAPVAGSFRGNDTSVMLDVELMIEAS